MKKQMSFLLFSKATKEQEKHVHLIQKSTKSGMNKAFETKGLKQNLDQILKVNIGHRFLNPVWGVAYAHSYALLVFALILWTKSTEISAFETGIPVCLGFTLKRLLVTILGQREKKGHVNV